MNPKATSAGAGASFARIARIAKWCVERRVALLSAVLFAAFALRLYALVSLHDSIYAENLMPDEQVYHAWARSLAYGEDAPDFIHDFGRVPAHVYALLYRVFGPSTDVVRAFNLLLGTATCFLVYLLGRRLGGEHVGLAAAALAALYRPFVFFSVAVHSVALGVFMFAAALVQLAALLERGRVGHWLALGVLLGLLLHVRPNCVVVAALVPLLLWHFRRRDAARPAALARELLAYAAGLLLALWPLSPTRDGLAATPEFGFNFYVANHLGRESPYFQPVAFASAQPAYQAVGFVVEASRRQDRKLSVSEASRYWTFEVLRGWAEQPAAAAERAAYKLLASVNRYEPANNHDLDFVAGFVRALRLPLLSFWLLFPLGVAGALAFFRERRAAGVLAAVALAYFATLPPFFVDVRIRTPLLVPLLPFAAQALFGLFGASDARARRRLALSAATVLALGFVPVPGAFDRSTAHNFHALFLYDAGELSAAKRHYVASVRQAGADSESAYLGLAAIAEREQQPALAIEYLRRIPDDHYKAADKYASLGNILARAREAEAALDAYQRSLAIDSSNLQLYRHVHALQRILGRDAAAAEVARKQRYIASFYAGASARKQLAEPLQ